MVLISCSYGVDIVFIWCSYRVHMVFISCSYQARVQEFVRGGPQNLKAFFYFFFLFSIFQGGGPSSENS